MITTEQAQQVKAEIEETPFLFSARHNRDYETIAVFCSERWPQFKLTEIEVHQILKG